MQDNYISYINKARQLVVALSLLQYYVTREHIHCIKYNACHSFNYLDQKKKKN